MCRSKLFGKPILQRTQTALTSRATSCCPGFSLPRFREVDQDKTSYKPVREHACKRGSTAASLELFHRGVCSKGVPVLDGISKGLHVREARTHALEVGQVAFAGVEDERPNLQGTQQSIDSILRGIGVQTLQQHL